MLSKAQVVRTRKAIESLYIGSCTVSEYQKVIKPNKSTGFKEVVVLENQPCRVSFKNINATNPTDNLASSVVQIITLFIAPELAIKPGSKITVNQNNTVKSYKASGEPALYDTHQELVLELFDDWA